MNYLKYPKIFTFFLGALLFFSACKKDSDTTYQPPVTEPLTITTAKLGDTIVIKGQNFSATVSENVVTFNGVEATIIRATATEIVVVVPANATSGKVEITVHGQTTEVGTLTLVPLSLYVTKEIEKTSGYTRQLVAISPVDGKETVVLTFDKSQNFMYTTHFLAATNEVIGLDDDGVQLMKVNVLTKQTSAVTLSTSGSVQFWSIVTDNSGNVYGVKYDNTNQAQSTLSLTKIDVNTGAHTVIATWPFTDTWNNLVYLPETNEIAGLTQSSRKLFKVNLTTKATSAVQLTTLSNIDHYYLVITKSGLYGIKYDIGANSTVANLVKINPANGSMTTISPISDDDAIQYNFVYIPQRNEIAAIWNDVQLYRYNFNTNSSSLTTLTTDVNTYYSYLSSN